MSDSLRRNTMLGSPSSNNSGGGGTSASRSYTVNLNGQWELTTTPANPDPALYDGVYRSFSNYNVNNSAAIMYITIKDCSSFKVYIRSYAESIWDYVMISQLDQIINGSTSYSNITLVKAHTRGNQQSGTTLSNYTLVEYTGITSGEHTVTVVYRKDSRSHSGDDRGYVLIPKLQSGGGGGGYEGPIDINNYLTIEALEDGLTAKLSTNACEYCIDGDGVWNTLTANTTTPSINQGQVISFRGNLTPSNYMGMGTFTISKKCNLKGNCMSMLFGDDAENNYSLSGKNFTFYKMFYNCTNIIEISPNFLPATTLANYCYGYMFYNCTSLTTAPELPATTLADYCYYYMFYGCTSLTTATELPATTLANYCYGYMFYNCTSLTTAPELPATTLADSCYDSMFYGCTSLTTAPSILPATTLADSCYNSMFQNCTSLATAPELPATTLASRCYYYMFGGCTSLTTAPSILPATTLANNCYSNMFSKCTSLTTAPELPATTLASRCYYSMFSDTNVLPDCSNIDFSSNSVVSSGGLIGLFYGTKVTDDDLKNILPINPLTGNYYLPATTLSSNCYGYMFYDCKSLTTAPELPATTLASDCYDSMFYNCTSLTTAPELPATTLASRCYNSMFSGCKSLTIAPELHATTLADSCYGSMFGGCTSLTTAPELPATTLANYCYYYMFRGCTSLTTAPSILPATTLASSCYYSMFDSCKSLTTAPELSATTLADSCYDSMFYGCSKLNYIKAMFTTTPSSSYTNNWVRGVSSTGTFVKNKDATWNVTGNNGIPSGWTVIEEDPS